MMRRFKGLCAIAFLCVGIGYPSAALRAQGVSVNYDRLSSLEEPLAFGIGDVTFSATGVIDAPIRFDLQPNFRDDVNPNFIANTEISAAAQLPNRWNVAVRYFGQYTADIGSILNFRGGPNGGRFTDNVAASITGAWGALIGGNTMNIVREETRRLRGVGNGALAYDTSFAQLGMWGGGYVGQFGPARLSAIVDGQGNFDIGASWSRPIGNKDYRFTARFISADFISADTRARVNSDAFGLVADFIYGSGRYDLGGGYENLEVSGISLDRWYVSAGARYKLGAWSASLEGHYGETDGQEEISAAFGFQYDIARGLSANIGINHADAQIVASQVALVNQKATEALLSLRYSY